MTSPDARLAALFAADLPPARDPSFQAEVLARLARRRFIEETAWLGGLCLAGAAVLAALWPQGGPVLARLGADLAAPGLALSFAVCLVLMFGGRDAGLAS